MYENFYHLRAKPFRLSPDPGFFFASRGHKRALAYLRYGLSQSEGFVVITGAPGTGKTTLAQILLQEMDQSDVVVAHLTTTQLEADEMLRMVMASFGLRYEGQNKASLLKTLEAFFMARSREHKRVLLVVDEAQNLPARSLEELRMLSNLQVGDKALLQTFLLGQVQFRQMLDHPDLEQLSQRVIANYHLSALGEDECQTYIESRLSHVGWQNDPCFTEDAFEIIHEYTEGIPRRINMLCDRVMLFSSLEEQHEINASVLRNVTDELQSEISGRPIARVELSEELPDVSAVAPEPAATNTSEPVTEQDVELKPDLIEEAEVSATEVAAPSVADQDSTSVEEPAIAVSLPEDSAMDRAVSDDGWNQLVAQAQPDEIETDNADNQPAEMERFRVIAGGREAEQGGVETAAVRPANQPSPAVAAPLPDAPGDSQEVVLRKILRLVLAFHRSPRSFPGLDDPTQALPKGIKAILELAIADDQVLTSLRQIAVMGISPAMLRSAVRFFVRRVMFLPGGDDYRVLGLPTGASLSAVETHYGLLMKLLRQDKKDHEESGVARIGEAYERLCRADITTAPDPEPEKVTESLDNGVEEELDLDLSPSFTRGGDNSAQRRPSAASVDIVTSGERNGPTSRNIMLIAGAAVIVFILYLTQVRTTENPTPDVVAATPEVATVVADQVVLEDVTTATPSVIEIEPLAAEVTQQAELPTAQVLQADEARARAEVQKIAAAEADEKARAIAEAEAQAIAVARLKAEIAVKAEEAARIEAAAVAKIEAEAKAKAAAREVDLRQQAAAKAKARAEEAARLKAAAKQAELRQQAAAKARAERETARLKAAAKAKAESKAALAAKAQADADAQVVASASLVSPTALNKLVSVFEVAYKSGDINRLMDLYSSTVRTNDQTDAAGVRSEYQSLFSGSTERNIKLSNMNWTHEGSYARGTGQYAVSVMHKGKTAAHQETGKVTLQVEESAGKLQITRFYSSDPVVVKTPPVQLPEVGVATSAVKTGVVNNLLTQITAAEVNALLGQLSTTYAAGDINAFMRLFAKDAQTNDRATVQGIRKDYVDLFNSTASRTIAFTKMQWTWQDQVARGEGAYDVVVQANGQTRRDRYQGPVWIQLERRGGNVRITHFAFAE